MVGELIMLPVRVGVRATRFWLRAAEETTSLAFSATQQLIGLAGSRGSSGSASPIAPPRPGSDPFEPPEPAPRRAADRTTSPADAATAAVESPPPTSAKPLVPDRPTDPEPVHVSEEPTLVEEFAEPGAEDGAGAEVHVEEPWDGYAHMSAKHILARLSSATPAELAAVQLYEVGHRGRQTIVNAVERQLRRANGRSGRSQ